MRCPYCKKTIADEVTLSGAAAISGRRGKRKLAPEAARAMQARSVAARKKNKEGLGREWNHNR